MTKSWSKVILNFEPLRVGKCQSPQQWFCVGQSEPRKNPPSPLADTDLRMTASIPWKDVATWASGSLLEKHECSGQVTGEFIGRENNRKFNLTSSRLDNKVMSLITSLKGPSSKNENQGSLPEYAKWDPPPLHFWAVSCQRCLVSCSSSIYLGCIAVESSFQNTIFFNCHISGPLGSIWTYDTIIPLRIRCSP